jgi:hypothetical protein
MSVFNISQQEAETLIAVEKHAIQQAVNDYPIRLPERGGGISVKLESLDKKEEFYLDIGRGTINLAKIKNQTRARKSIVLVRLDIGGSPHRNPDDQEVSGDHIHLYREGYGDKWAYPVPLDKFPNINDFWLTIHDFLRYCNVTQAPNFDKQQLLAGL